jgi:hypothetical protein
VNIYIYIYIYIEMDVVEIRKQLITHNNNISQPSSNGQIRANKGHVSVMREKPPFCDYEVTPMKIGILCSYKTFFSIRICFMIVIICLISIKCE